MPNNITKTNNNLTLTVTPPRQCISLSIADAHSQCLFEETISYDDLSPEFKFLFSSVEELYEAMNEQGKLVFDHNGAVEIVCSVSIGSKKVDKSLKLQLKGRMGGNEEIRMIRRDIEAYKHQVTELRHEVAGLREQNSQLSVKFKYLEQLSQMNLVGQAVSQAPPPTFSQGFSTQVTEIKTAQQQIKTSIVEEKLQPKKEEALEKKEESEQEPQPEADGPKKYKKIPFKLSPACAYLDKYKIDGQSVTSLCEDYYQLYFDEPLPNKGTYLVRIRIPGSIHGSIGIIAESQLGNQYSFQNKKSICFYSYSYGNFRGLYDRSNYSALTWQIQPNEIVNIELNMNKKQIVYWMEGLDQDATIDFAELAREGKMRVFFELYEKDVTLEFL